MSVIISDLHQNHNGHPQFKAECTQCTWFTTGGKRVIEGASYVHENRLCIHSFGFAKHNLT